MWKSLIATSLSHNVPLTHWGRVTHIFVSKLAIIGSDNGLSPERRQAIIGTNDGLLLIGILGTDFGEILSEMYTFSVKKMHLKKSSTKWWPFCLGLNVLNLQHNSLTDTCGRALAEYRCPLSEVIPETISTNIMSIVIYSGESRKQTKNEQERQ